jgi:hypothetical protein
MAMRDFNAKHHMSGGGMSPSVPLGLRTSDSHCLNTESNLICFSLTDLMSKKTWGKSI